MSAKLGVSLSGDCGEEELLDDSDDILSEQLPFLSADPVSRPHRCVRPFENQTHSQIETEF